MNIKALLTVCFCVVTASAVTAQNIIANQFGFSASRGNSPSNIYLMSDGNYYLFSYVYFMPINGNMGDIPAPQRGESFGVLSKFNNNHELLWSKSYGGDSTDSFNGFVKVNDGFLICATSNSPVSGTKTVESNNRFHIWLQKVDFEGEILWQKGYFTDHNNNILDFASIGNNEFVISSIANTGVSGDKTDFGYGETDGWLIKIDGEGNIIWDKAIGTTGFDFSFTIVGQFDNGDFLIHSFSEQGASGAKTEESYGSIDNWLLRLNRENGSVVWDKTIGGSGSENLTKVKIINDEIWMYVFTNSDISGLRTVPKKGTADIWFLKMDENGNVLNQKSYGGNGSDGVSNFIVQEDNIILISFSNSNESMDKNEDSRGGRDLWLLKMDLEGNILNQKTLGGNLDDIPTAIDQLSNGNFLIACISESGVSGDKTTPRVSTNGSDSWIIEIDHVTLNVVNRFEEGNAYILYPNPSKDECNIKFEAPFALQNAQLFDLTGKLVLEQSYQLGEQTNFMFSTKGLPKGNYTLLLSGKNLQKAHQLAVE